MKNILLALSAVLLTTAVCGRAEDGYRLWMRYDALPPASAQSWGASVSTIVAPGDSVTMRAIRAELQPALSGLLGKLVEVSANNTIANGALVVGTPSTCSAIASLKLGDALAAVGDEGFLIRSEKINGRAVTVVAANSERGALYGAFHFLRLVQTSPAPSAFVVSEKPGFMFRLLNHWDNLDGSIERGYAGQSLWKWDELPGTVDPRLADYARANASLGINGTVLNNVNASAKSLTPEYLRKAAAIADVFRPYGMRVYLVPRFSAPIEIGGLKTADPLDPKVAAWWKAKTDEIYKIIPDFGGYLVKANSEGQPGPMTYGRTHADGANMLAAAVAPHGGIVMWRAFVYDPTPGSDRAAQAYDTLKPLDGKFADNVIVQVKNGPVDFMPREPFHPIFGGLPRTQIMPELQITQEYLGFSNSVAFLATMWREFFDADTHSKGPGSTVAKVVDGSLYGQKLTAIAGVANTGDDRNWTGHHLAQANWFAFGRLAWNPETSAEKIAGEWTAMTLTHDEKAAAVITRLLLESREAVVNYEMPLGLAHLMNAPHYGPAPWGHPVPREDWSPLYYHRAAKDGIGFDRTPSGSNAVAQYHEPLRSRLANLSTCPDELLLWFHHVPWTYKMRSGRTLWDELCLRYQRGVNWTAAARKRWDSLAGSIDAGRHAAVADKLVIQQRDAKWWREAGLLYFQTFSGQPFPADVDQPTRTLAEVKALDDYGLPHKPSFGLGIPFVLEHPDVGSFPLVREKQAAMLILDKSDWTGVLRAAGDLQADIQRVSGVRPALEKIADAAHPRAGKPVVMIGTLGKSAIIDALAKAGKISTARIEGKWESFVISVVANPQPGIERALVIAGSDKRGTIYGIYEISEQIGVSPWYWWADVPTRKQEQIFIKEGTYVQEPPAVKYRGIFINDEEPAFGQWARVKFGGVNSKMYSHMFELILRMRGNYLWPAMWGKAFNEDDPLNPKVADEYGIVMGTSHHEPMMRAQKEWSKNKKEYGNAEWNYATNEKGLKQFWQDGISRNKAYEQIVTIGMRGDGDEPMVKDGDTAANMALMERIVADQRNILAKIINPDVIKIPQTWALYKEVADYYQDGMRVPDDVTLLWCDDNWGNNRRLPTAEERKRSGGAGIYYHFDYVGGPRSYKWINTNPLPKIWEQMSMAYEYGADRIWIVNVGDLKPMELPTEFFLRLAWNPSALPKEKIADFTRLWASREFGEKHAADIAAIVSRYAKYNGWRKPELLEPKTFSLVNYQEAERVLAGWSEIVSMAEKINKELPLEARDAFFQLVLYPAKASATVVELHIATGLNHLYAKQKRASTNLMARHVRALFEEDKNLSNAYHAINDGKWRNMMAQTRIGYTSWNDPKTNIMPKLEEITVQDEASMGVAVEGSESAWPGGTKPAKLPQFDSINQQHFAIEIYKRGGKDFSYGAAVDQPWVKLSSSGGVVKSDQRIWVGIDWEKAPLGNSEATVTITRPGGESVPVQVNAMRSEKHTRENTNAFGGLTGPTAIIAANATQNVAAGGTRWDVIPDYGRGPSGMTIFPMTAASVEPPVNSPRLEYQVLIPQAGDIRVDLITGPTLNVQPGRGVRVAVSFDDQPPHIIDAFTGQGDGRGGSHSPAIRDWGTWVKDNARTMKSTHTISEPGVHTLKIWMVDPGVVLEKLIIHTGDVRPSYFGPPASNLRGTEK